MYLTHRLLRLATILAIPMLGLTWGPKGHQTVGQLAQLYLEGTPTLTRVKGILKSGDTLANISTWPDTIKNEKIPTTKTFPDADTLSFLKKVANQNNRNWHFVDLPLDCATYDSCPDQFKNNKDIVHRINDCIRVLQGNPVTGLNKRNALRMLVHLVGDLHQPLHVGSGYLDVDTGEETAVIVRDPEKIKDQGLDSDHGANLLLIDGSDSKPLHSHWDNNLAKLASNNQNVNDFAQDLKDHLPGNSSMSGTGDVKTWAAQFASESDNVSSLKAYDLTLFKISNLITSDTSDSVKVAIEFTGDYDGVNTPVAREQIAKAGFRLAQILIAILP
jgi:hypothetical protein